MRLSDIIRRSSRSIKSSKGRTLLTALAISVGTFALTLTLAASNGAQNFVDQIISENFDPAELIVSADEAVLGEASSSTPQEYDSDFGSSLSASGAQFQVKMLTDEDINEIADQEYVDSVREDVAVGLAYVTRTDQKKYVATIGSLTPIQNPPTSAGEVIKPVKDKTLLLPEPFVESLGYESSEAAVGSVLTLGIKQSLPLGGKIVEEEFTVAAVLEPQSVAQPGTELYLYTNSDETRRLYDITTEGTDQFGKFMTVNARIIDGDNPDVLKQAQSDLKDLGFYTISAEDTQEFLNQAIGILQTIVIVFGAIAIIASIFGIVNTMYISVLQRTREIGLMKALGMRKKDIGRLFRFEAAWIGFIGGVLGAGLALLVGVFANPVIRDAIGSDDDLLIFKPLQVILLVVLMVVISILAGWLPSRKAAKLDPIEALRTE